MANIPIDCNRWMPSSCKSGQVLLYDTANKCYYETSLASILARVDAKYEKSIESIKTALAEAVAELKAQQSKFIEDSAKMNDTILHIAKEHNTNE